MATHLELPVVSRSLLTACGQLCAWSGESGGSARKEERDSTPGCGIISGVNAGDNHGGGREHVREDGDAASIGCAQSDGDTARGGNDGHGVTLDSDTTMQRSPLNFEDAIAFNLAYEKENNTPPYNRLPVLPLRLGSGLAASALPCGPLTHSSAGWQLLGAVSTAAMNHGWRPGPGDGKVHLRPLKRQRMDNDGGNTLGQNFAFVLDRCWNCGSYGHHLQGCIHPRNHAVVEACRRESSQLAQRTVRQAAAAQQRGPRKASYRRYFSMATAEEEREATAASCAGLGAVPACYSNCGELKRAPRDIRPGSLSTTLALALNLSCPSDPPPWLIGMAVHGIPPAYCRGPYIPDTTPPLALALGPPSAEPSDTAAWEGTCSEALCGVPVTAATIAAAAESCGQDGNDGCGAVIAQAIELLDGNPGRAAGDSAEGLPPKAMDLECPKGSTYPDTRHISVLEKWVVKQADITAAGKGSSGARMGCCKGDDGNGPVVVLGSIAALPGSFPDSEGLEGTSSSRAFAVEQQARSGLGTAAVAVAGTVAVESAPGFRGGEGACEESGPAMEEAALKGRCRDCSDSLASGTEVLILPDGMEPATLLHAAVGVEEMDPELDVDMDVDTDVHTVSLDIAAARAVAAGSTGSEADADADAEMALLLQPLLPDAPRHVLFAGLNTSIGQGACREHWQRALMSARQVMACVAAVGGCRRRHEGPQLSTWAAKVTGSGQGPSGAAVDAAPEQVEAVKVAAQAKAMDVPQTEEQPQPQTQQGWQRESFPQVRQSQPQWQSSMLTQEGFQQPAWFHQQKQQLAENHFRMQQHIMMLQQQQQQQHIWPATAFPMFFGGPTFQGLC
ncbi:hypothetical protein Vafri_9055 [Volvox africanus]|uniref:CCHC-type domain-containing protein n=1 Tax=Volvox africanus TaxID=51714 RepID=A0A8J4F255_9CHLO|nr:hypothetical protein Vafri_9055 [Volvox africanus]